MSGPSQKPTLSEALLAGVNEAKEEIRLPNLYQRITAITAEVGGIKPTGKTAPNQGAQPALSITDIEDALSPLLVKHGVVTGYSFNNAPVQADKQGNMTLWAVDLNVWLVNAENPDDRREDRACDVGSSPSAAVSFCLKRYFRALFHLSEPDEHEIRTTAVQSSRSSSEARPEVVKSPADSPAENPSGPASSGRSNGDRKETKGQATLRLMKAFTGSGLDTAALDDLASRMEPTVKRWGDLNAEFTTALADEVEALRASTAGVAT